MAELVTASDCYELFHRKVVSSSLTGAVAFCLLLSAILRTSTETLRVLDHLPFMQSLIFKYVRLLLFDEQYFWITASLVILGDAILTQLIMRFVPC
jgi:hypothetical protein